MATAAIVPEDGTLLSRLDRALERVEEVLALISGLAVFTMMLLAVFSVVAAVIYYNAQEEAPPLRPGIEQEAPVP